MLAAAESAAAELERRRARRDRVGRPGGLRPRSGHAGRCRRHAVVVTAEDGIRQGGAGMFLADALRQARVPAAPRHRSSRSGIPRAYIAQGKPDRILAELGLDGPGLARSVRAAQSVVRETRRPAAESTGDVAPGHADRSRHGRLRFVGKRTDTDGSLYKELLTARASASSVAAEAGVVTPAALVSRTLRLTKSEPCRSSTYPVPVPSTW